MPGRAVGGKVCRVLSLTEKKVVFLPDALPPLSVYHLTPHSYTCTNSVWVQDLVPRGSRERITEIPFRKRFGTFRMR